MSRRKKIAFVSNTTWSIYNFRLGIIKRLIEMDTTVVIIAPEDPYTSKLEEIGCQFYNLSLSNYSTNPLKDIRTTIQLTLLYRKIKPDFVFHYTIKPNFYGSIAAYLNKIPSIAITTGLGHLFFSNPIVTFITTNLYKLTSKLSKEIWFLNKSDQAIFIKKKIVNQENTFLLNSEGVNTSYFRPQPRLTYTNKIIFLYAGRMLKDKGVELLVEASKILKKKDLKFELQLLGEINKNNPNSVTHQQMSRWQIEGHIRYLGVTSDVRPFIANADCIVFPSYYGEGVSRILLESASMSKTIITTDHVGCREVVDHHKNGYLAQPRDLNSLVKAMKNFLLLNKEQRKRMEHYGREKVLKEFNQADIVKIYLEKLDKKTLKGKKIVKRV